MININEAFESSKEDIEAVSEWCEKVYHNNFESHFTESRCLFERLKSKTHPITDEELSWILITLPIDLFEASESLNRLKINQEVAKLKYKQNEAEFMKKSTAKSVTQKRDEAAVQMLDDKLLILAYDSVISRVESEISLSRELIMGAKKIWDARRKTDSVMPVGEVNTPDAPLPDYQNKKYIHGGTY
ncbi:MAG: hypothetical protein NC320_01880 [Clostridium sp.]|nr:hypothetical protein [Clostridium sp.]